MESNRAALAALALMGFVLALMALRKSFMRQTEDQGEPREEAEKPATTPPGPAPQGETETRNVAISTPFAVSSSSGSSLEEHIFKTPLRDVESLNVRLFSVRPPSRESFTVQVQDPSLTPAPLYTAQIPEAPDPLTPDVLTSLVPLTHLVWTWDGGRLAVENTAQAQFDVEISLTPLAAVALGWPLANLSLVLSPGDRVGAPHPPGWKRTELRLVDHTFLPSNDDVLCAVPETVSLEGNEIKRILSQSTDLFKLKLNVAFVTHGDDEVTDDPTATFKVLIDINSSQSFLQ